MYSSRPAIIYGFHGTDRKVGMKILTGRKKMLPSNNAYDWLGSGTYFWENNLERAEQYAVEDSKRSNSSIQQPFVLGAVIELGHCLDLLNQKSNDTLKQAHKQLKSKLSLLGLPMPVNRKFGKKDFDFKARELDCMVIREACAMARAEGKPYDSVRAAFIEGKPIYTGAKFHQQNHIQVAVINHNCIKGIFLPRQKVDLI